MKAITGIFSNIFGKVKPVFTIIGQVVKGIVLLSIFGMNVLMGYIMFAPDDLPKPFYLSYAGQGTTTVIMPPANSNYAAPTSAAGGAPGKSATPVPAEPGNGMMVDTGTKLVNLSDPSGRRYLRAAIVMEVMPPTEVLAAMKATPAKSGSESTTTSPLVTAFNDEVNAKMPVINDTITSLLSSKTFESIYTVEGKDQLREEIKQQLNQRLPDLQVIAIYFTEFVVQ